MYFKKNCFIFTFLIFKFVSNAQIINSETAIDLTWGFDSSTLYWPNNRPFEFTKQQAGYINNDTWYSTNDFCAGEHGGTHFDAPYHFYKDGWKVGDIPISKLIGPAAIVDVSEVVGDNREFLLQRNHLEEWERENGPFRPNTILIIRFGWSRNYKSKELYFGQTADEKLHFPGISGDAANWIASKDNIVGVGVDTPSTDGGSAANLVTHVTLHSRNLYGIENLKLLQTLPAYNSTLIVMPMKITEGTGAPCRVVLIPE